MRVPSCTVQAVPVAAGIAIGRVMLIHGNQSQSAKNVSITAAEVPGELARFHAAMDVTRQQLVQLREKLGSHLAEDDQNVFDAHILLVEDRTLVSEVERFISEELLDAESSVYRAMDKFAVAFSAVEDPYLRERALDIRDVGSRIAGNISDAEKNSPAYDEPRIVISRCS